jgi:hypothetical protein
LETFLLYCVFPCSADLSKGERQLELACLSGVRIDAVHCSKLEVSGDVDVSAGSSVRLLKCEDSMMAIDGRDSRVARRLDQSQFLHSN